MAVERHDVSDNHIAALINEGSQIKRALNVSEERLKEIKEKLKTYELPAGKHVTKDVNYVKVTKSDDYDPPDPKSTMKLMRELGFGRQFVNVVTITIKKLETYLNKDEIKSVRKKKGIKISFSFG